MRSVYACSFCGQQVAVDPDYGGYVHLDVGGDPDRTEHGHYADPDYTSESTWLSQQDPRAPR